MEPRKRADCPNYSIGELACSCGCGKDSTDDLYLRLQAFIFFMSRLLETKIKHIVSGGARCKAKNDATPGSALWSYHLVGGAADGIFLMQTGKKFIQIQNEDVASMARQSGLFGGIGQKKYHDMGKNLVHLDNRPGEIVTW